MQCELSCLSVCLSVCLCLISLSTTTYAQNGTIDEPGAGGDQMENADFWPFGSYDEILHEEGPVSIVVHYKFEKMGQTGGAFLPMSGEFSGGSWWADENGGIVVPGGDYIGGTWAVILYVNGVLEDSKGGSIVASEE